MNGRLIDTTQQCRDPSVSYGWIVRSTAPQSSDMLPRGNEQPQSSIVESSPGSVVDLVVRDQPAAMYDVPAAQVPPQATQATPPEEALPAASSDHRSQTPRRRHLPWWYGNAPAPPLKMIRGQVIYDANSVVPSPLPAPTNVQATQGADNNSASAVGVEIKAGVEVEIEAEDKGKAADKAEDKDKGKVEEPRQLTGDDMFAMQTRAIEYSETIRNSLGSPQTPESLTIPGGGVTVFRWRTAEGQTGRLVGCRGGLYVPAQTSGQSQLCPYFSLHALLPEWRRAQVSDVSKPLSEGDINLIKAYCHDALNSYCFNEGNIAAHVNVVQLHGYLMDMKTICEARGLPFDYAIPAPEEQELVVRTYIAAAVYIDIPRDTFFIGALARFAGVNLRAFVLPSSPAQPLAPQPLPPQPPYALELERRADATRTCNVLLGRNHFETCHALTPEDAELVCACCPAIKAVYDGSPLSASATKSTVPPPTAKSKPADKQPRDKVDGSGAASSPSLGHGVQSDKSSAASGAATQEEFPLLAYPPSYVKDLPHGIQSKRGFLILNPEAGFD